MRRTFCFIIRIVFICIISAVSSQYITAQTNESQPDDPNTNIFMAFLRSNWDDIHDVVMRFHYDDPQLKGIVFIQMEWQNGKLISASVDSNNTGNTEFGVDLIEAMNKWSIPGMSDVWAMTIPFKTVIVGSNQPEFSICGIFTGKVLDVNKNPIHGAKLNLTSLNNKNSDPKPVFTNREGIFIKTLIPYGDWSLTCTKDGYLTVTIDKLSFGKGEHVKKFIKMNQ